MTAMQELAKHLSDAWSSPGDLWHPDKIIEKVESMFEKEKKQIIEAYSKGLINGSGSHFLQKKKSGEQYYNETFKNNVCP